MTHPFIDFQNGPKAHFITYNCDGNGQYRATDMLIQRVGGESVASIDAAEARVLKLIDEKLGERERFSFTEEEGAVHEITNGRTIPQIGCLIFEVNRAINRVAATSRRGRGNHLMMNPQTFDRFKWACGVFGTVAGDHLFRETLGSGQQGEGAPAATGWSLRGEAYTKDPHNPTRVWSHPDFRPNTILVGFKGDRMDGPAAIIDGEGGLKLCLNKGSITSPERFFSLVSI